MMILGSLTLLPALLGWVGTRIDNTSRAALIAVGIAVVGAIVGFFTGQAALYLAGFVAGDRLLRRSASPSSRCASSSRTAPSAPRSSASGTAGAASSSTGRGRACSAPPACCSCWRSRCSRSASASATTATCPRTRPSAGPTTCSPRASGPGTNGPLFITVEGDAATDQAAARRSSSQTIAGTEDVATAFPAADQRRAWRSSSSTRTSAPQDAETTDARRHAARRRDPGDRRRRQGRRPHGRVRRLRQLPRRAHAAADRRRAAAQLPPADGRVPQPPRAAQGGGHEPAVDRRRLRHPRRHLPVGLGHGADRRRPGRADRGLGADVPVRHRVRPVDGLRGVPALPHQGGVRPHRRTTPPPSPTAWPPRPGSSPPPR